MRVEVPCALVRPLVTRKSLAEASVLIPGPRWCASVRLTMCRTAVERESRLCAVASSGLRPSRVVSNRLRL